MLIVFGEYLEKGNDRLKMTMNHKLFNLKEDS